MRMLLIVGFVCLLVACIMGATAMASKGYRRVKAGFNIGRSGFYIEADDDEVRRDGFWVSGPAATPRSGGSPARRWPPLLRRRRR